MGSRARQRRAVKSLVALYLVALVGGGLIATLARIGLRRSAVSKPSAAIRFLPLPALACVLQLLAIRWVAGGNRTALFLSSELLLLAFLLANWGCRPMQLVTLGFLLNLLPIMFNGGYMPITPESVVAINPGETAALPPGLPHAGSKDVILPRHATAWWFLGDVFTISRLGPFSAAFSMGDMLILLGFVWAVYECKPTSTAQTRLSRA